MNQNIFVTQSLLPERDVFFEYVENIFQTQCLTNNGSHCQALERAIGKFIEEKFVTLTANGTLGLQIALHAAGLAGKTIITTPFSYVATVSAALWVGCQVVFADIDENTLTIDPQKIAGAMTEDTAGIMPVNVYGHPCDASGIEKAAGPGVKIIYDAAQAFGCTEGGRSLLDFGDFAVCSLHATKVFHTFEGGFVVSHSQEARKALELLRAFGHRGDDHYCLGINAKISEAHAAMGLSLFPQFSEHLNARKKISLAYDALLNHNRLRVPLVPAGFESNYSYYPVIFESEQILLKTMRALAEKKIFPRRYFYPSLNTLPYLTYQSCPVSENIAKRVLCLPLYSRLPLEAAEQICAVVNETLK